MELSKTGQMGIEYHITLDMANFHSPKLGSAIIPLIKLQPQTINGNAVETVSARELHTFLEVGRDFSTWIKDRISKYEFVENTDYIMLPKTGELENKGLQGKIEYFVTLDMAKQLAMVENNEKGMQVRKYFIECEKKLNSTTTTQVQVVGKAEDATRAALLLSQHLNIKGPALETFLVTTVERIIGVEIPYRPLIEQRTYSAAEIGDVLGISANKVGRIANAHGLKTDDYGMLYLSKSQHGPKQVETWRYYDCAIDRFKSILENE